MGHLKQYNKRQDKRQHLRRGNGGGGGSTKPTANAVVVYNPPVGYSSGNTGVTVQQTPTASASQQANFSSTYANLRQTLPMQQTSWLGLISAGAPALATTVMSGIQYANARKDAKNQQALVDNLMSQYMSKPIENPYSNMPVATQAAEMQAIETDQALANTLDNLRATGYAAGGATALANAAAKSKQQIAASIEKQEAANARLEAKGRELVQSAEFARMDQQMDYEQSKADLYRAQEGAALSSLVEGGATLGALGYQQQTKTVTQQQMDQGTPFIN